jgi:hypothetical protein
MTDDVSAEDMLDRLRHSIHRLLQWAEAYRPTTLYERERYDADLDEAEDVLDATNAWLALHADGPGGLHPDGSRRIK